MGILEGFLFPYAEVKLVALLKCELPNFNSRGQHIFSSCHTCFSSVNEKWAYFGILPILAGMLSSRKGNTFGKSDICPPLISREVMGCSQIFHPCVAQHFILFPLQKMMFGDSARISSTSL